MNFISNFGLEFLTDTAEKTIAFCKAVCARGKVINGYYNCPYVNCEFGYPQFVVRTRLSEDGEKLSVSGMDTHLSGVTQWKFGIKKCFEACEDNDPLTRKIMAYKLDDGSGIAMITLVNADVLPSFLEQDEINAQMVGFPIQINYYESEDAYAEDQPEALNGKKILLSDGALFPSGLLSDKENEASLEENLMLIRGTVKKAKMGLVKFGEEEGWNYLNVIIGTQFGDLEIVHTMEQVEESERNLIKVGSVVLGLFYLSGDVAIKEYKEGFILDYEHNLALLRYTLQEGDAERLRVALSDNVEYISEWAKTTYFGKEEVINKFNRVKGFDIRQKFFAHFATIIRVDGGDEELPYTVGDRCIVIAMGSEDNLESICFMECDDKNKISKIVVTRNSRYHFKLDEKKRYPDLIDFTVPKDFYESILGRAHFHGFLDNEQTREDVESHSKKTDYYKKSAQVAVNNLKIQPQANAHEAIPPIFSALFLQAIEIALYSKYPIPTQTDLIDEFAYWENCCTHYENEEENEHLKKRLHDSYELASQFYKDFSLYRHRLKTEEGYEDDLIAALVFVQQIGEIYGKTELNKIREEK